MVWELGFTLIELLVVMAILGVLAGIGLQSFQTSQAKGRDARRKSDLEQIQRALEMYYNDYRKYPASLNFGGQWIDSKGTVYMKSVPNDPSLGKNYCYETDSTGTYYKVFSILENKQDPSYGNYSCGGNTYNYGVSSTNVSLND